MTDSAAADMSTLKIWWRAEASPELAQAHFAKGQVLRSQGRFQEAISEYETVIAYNPNWAFAIYALVWCKYMTGSIEEVIPLVAQAISLSPRDPSIVLGTAGLDGCIWAAVEHRRGDRLV
jgi:tetratricopeptide (TPR) repeat protein